MTKLPPNTSPSNIITLGLWFQCITFGFPDGSVGKEYFYNARDTGDVDLIPGSGRSPGEGNGNPLQYSCLKNPMDRGASWIAKSCMQHVQLTWPG